MRKIYTANTRVCGLLILLCVQSMNYSRLHKLVFWVLLVTLVIAFPFAIKVDESANFFGLLVIISMSLYFPVYCLAAYKSGEIETRGPKVKRSESPFYYWFSMWFYLVTSFTFLLIIIVQQYT
jgi:hypothetical protein